MLFGYSCHATCTDDGTIHGDYPGYAQAILEERHPGCVALFLNGCGADQNPLPRFVKHIERTYGEVLASAVWLPCGWRGQAATRSIAAGCLPRA